MRGGEGESALHRGKEHLNREREREREEGLADTHTHTHTHTSIQEKEDSNTYEGGYARRRRRTCMESRRT
jgi:hypothetical protein